MNLPRFVAPVGLSNRRVAELVRRAGAVSAILLACAGSALAAPPEREAFNVNTADAATIARNIKGIGLKRAEQIVEYRKQHGPFTDAYELMAIKGIGERIIRNNESRIRLRDR
ncbi:MAG: helix-hairpin-helix domain-containing protein [Pseudomonadota bacterium]